jgi:hypothetical protein
VAIAFCSSAYISSGSTVQYFNVGHMRMYSTLVLAAKFSKVMLLGLRLTASCIQCQCQWYIVLQSTNSIDSVSVHSLRYSVHKCLTVREHFKAVVRNCS